MHVFILLMECCRMKFIFAWVRWNVIFLPSDYSKSYMKIWSCPRKNGKPICLIGLKCDEQGKYIPGSIQVSPLVWGIHQLLHHAEQLTKENMADFLSMDAYESDMQFFDNQMVEVTGGRACWTTAHLDFAEFY